MSGRSEIIPSTPQSNKRWMSARSLTTHTCTTWPSRCTWRTNAGDTTRMRPAFSGTWNATHGRALRPRPSHPRSMQRPARLLLRRARRHVRILGANRVDRALMEGSDAGALDRVCLLDRFADGTRQLRLPAFHLDDDAGIRMSRQHVVEPRHADSLSAKGMRAVDLEMKTCVDRRELRRGEAANRARAIGRAIERLIVDDDGNAVGGQLHVDLEAVGSERHAVVDRRHRVLGRQLRAAAMGEDERAIGSEDRRGHRLHRLIRLPHTRATEGADRSSFGAS